jgi:flagellar basal-body rod protein FlgG
MYKIVLLIIASNIISTDAYAIMRALNIAASGMSAQEQNVSTISNNIANANTIGFKKSRAEFDDLLYETIQAPGSSSGTNSNYNVGIQIGSGAKLSGTRKEFTIGNPIVTNNPFDLMINGDGFFGITQDNDKIRYTRDGAFNVNGQGMLVTKSGDPIYPGITFPEGTKNVVIDKNGNIEAYLSNQVNAVKLGTLPVFTFANPIGLQASGGNLYQASLSSGMAIEEVAGRNNAGNILQGTLESSNVSIMTEMTNLIKAQRAYEMNSKVMGVADQMLQTVNNIR